MASPNYASRQGHPIDTLVLHNTDGNLKSAVARFQDPKEQVSAHYIVDRDGSIVQMVSDSDTAWHSGNKDMNQRSIGVEVVAWNTAPGMLSAQQSALIALCKYVLSTYVIARVLPHRDVKPTNCPGWVWSTDQVFTTWVNANLMVDA